MEDIDLRLSDMLREEISKTTDSATAERLSKIADEIDARTLVVVMQDGVVKSAFANKFRIGSTILLNFDKAETRYAIEVPDGLVDGASTAAADFLQVEIRAPAAGQECAVEALAERAQEADELFERDARDERDMMSGMSSKWDGW